MGRQVLRTLAVVVVVIAGWTGMARAQDPAAPVPLHPIDTRPEGRSAGCSYSGTRGNGGTGSSTSTCAPGADAVPPVGSPLEGAQTNGQQTSGAQTSAPAPSAAKRFPFPGEETTPDVSAPEAPQPVRGATPADASGFHDAGSSGSSSSGSSSSSSSSSSGASGDDPAEPSPYADAPAPKRERKKLAKPVRQTPDEREVEDVQVAKFYMNDKNWRAAYLRGKDAVSLADDDPEAHMAVAEAARKLGKLDEAVAEYRKTLTLDPLPKPRKDAEKALKELTGTGTPDSLLP